MTAIGALLEHPDAQALAWALVHFFWQGAVIGTAAWMVCRFVPLSARSRYGIGAAALALMLAAPIVTTLVLRAETPTQTIAVPPAAPSISLPAADVVLVAPLAPKPEPVNPIEPFVLAVWLTGVVLLTARLIGGWFVARRFATRGLQPVAAEIETLARQVAQRIGLSRLVQLFESSAVAVPVTIGWLKPVVLLPMSAMSGLSNAQIEALLAHELAHVRRHDYLVNLLQSAVETLLFYHPAVWWVSKQMRTDREHCCDDVAIAICDRVIYVRALTDLATLASPFSGRLALAATDGSLMRRVKRILGDRTVDREVGPSWVSVAAVVLIVGGALPIGVASILRADTVDTNNQVTRADVVGGVQGVAGGVPGGVVGGVQGGVPGGVQSEVLQEVSPEGVRAIGNVHPLNAVLMEVSPELLITQDQQSAAVERLLQMQAEAERVRLQSEVARQQARLQIEIARDMATLENQQTSLLAQLEQSKRQLEDARKHVEVGTVPQHVLTSLQTQIRMQQAELENLQKQHALKQKEVEIKRGEIQEKAVHALRTLEIERERRDLASEVESRVHVLTREYLDQEKQLMSAMQEAQSQGRTQGPEITALRERLIVLERQLESLRRELNKLQIREHISGTIDVPIVELRRKADVGAIDLEELRTATVDRRNKLQVIFDERAAALGPSDTARAGDVVGLEIANEPDISRSYVIQADGTIRLPLIGSIAVQGMTATQVQAAIRKQFEDRRLTGGNTLQVTLRRPRRN
jgi:beta-lactamase regulating signal transducer with metallopeptidase domain